MSTNSRPLPATGPWAGEPNREEWRHAGFPCLAKRSPLGAWCGYVAVPPGHRFHGINYSSCTEGCEEPWSCGHVRPDEAVTVHGGLTYSDFCDGAEHEGICHVPAPDEPADVWWFGFDCAHHMDVIPTMLDTFGSGVYRNLAYVRAETSALAEQLAAES